MKIVKMSFERQILQEMGNGLKVGNSEKNWTPGVGLPHPGAIYMYITKIFKDLLL